MATRISEEQKQQINELYYENHNKSLTARILGISASSVAKYIIPDYVPVAMRKEVQYDIKPIGFEKFLNEIKSKTDVAFDIAYRDLTVLNEDEIKELEELRKEIYL